MITRYVSYLVHVEYVADDQRLTVHVPHANARIMDRDAEYEAASIVAAHSLVHIPNNFEIVLEGQ